MKTLLRIVGAVVICLVVLLVVLELPDLTLTTERQGFGLQEMR